MVDIHENLVPVSTTISGSSQTYYRSGDPPFTVTNTYVCNIGATIWVLVPSFTYSCEGVEVRDPTRNHRRIGPTYSGIADIAGCDESETDDDELRRLEPGQHLLKQYTFTTERKAHGRRPNDFRTLIVGNTYDLTVHKQGWCWMFEHDMPGECTSEERRSILRRQPATEWKPQCMATFKLMD